MKKIKKRLYVSGIFPLIPFLPTPITGGIEKGRQETRYATPKPAPERTHTGGNYTHKHNPIPERV